MKKILIIISLTLFLFVNTKAQSCCNDCVPMNDNYHVYGSILVDNTVYVDTIKACSPLILEGTTISLNGSDTIPSVFVNAAGYVGIGTVSQTHQFQVNGKGGGTAFLDSLFSLVFRNGTGHPEFIIDRLGGGNTRGCLGDCDSSKNGTVFKWFDLGKAFYFTNTDALAKVGINTTNPQYSLDVHGDFSLQNGSQGAGKLLQSDADGLSSWATVTAASLGAWQLTGNSGTTPGTNFIGTTDDVALQFKVNNTIAGVIGDAGSNTSFGRTTIDPANGGTHCSAFGKSALFSNTSGNYNSAFGENALVFNTNGIVNSAFGVNALKNNDEGDQNTAVGVGALFSGSGIGLNNNTAIGMYALYSATGAANVALGYSAGYYETGSEKLFIDNKERANEADARVKSLVYGQFNNHVTGQKFTINGVLQVNDSTQGAGKVMTSDASGNGSWQTPSGPTSDTVSRLSTGRVGFGNSAGHLTGDTAMRFFYYGGGGYPNLTVSKSNGFGYINTKTVKLGGNELGGTSTGGTLELYASDNYKTILATPSGMSADQTFILPNSSGSNLDQLTTDGGGNLFWQTPPTYYPIFNGIIIDSVTNLIGGTTTLSNHKSNIITASGAITSVTVTLPTSPSNGDIVGITNTQTIATLTFAGGTVVGAIITSVPVGAMRLEYFSARNVWYVW